MPSAGRILIIPKGDWDANKQYEMLDLVYHNGTSWLAKKSMIGIEPSIATIGVDEYWQKLCENSDVSELINRINNTDSRLDATETRVQALENESKNIDLSGYAKTTEVEEVANGLTDLRYDVSQLSTSVSELNNAVTDMGDLNANFSRRNELDYENLVTLDYEELPYVCPSAGEVTVYIEVSGAGVLRIDKNGMVGVCLQCINSDLPYAASTFPVAGGDVISRNDISHNIDVGTITFVPYKYQ